MSDKTIAVPEPVFMATLQILMQQHGQVIHVVDALRSLASQASQVREQTDPPK